jgi:uncharacterized protein YqeY
MSLKARITEDMKTAMKAKEAAKLGAIRLLLAAVKQKEVDERVELDDTAVVAVIEKLTKQRKDSVTQYEAAGRQELADAEKFEIGVLAAYLPEKMSSRRNRSRCRRRCGRNRRQGPGRHGQADGRPQAPPGRQSRHGRGFQTGEGRIGWLTHDGNARREDKPKTVL